MLPTASEGNAQTPRRRGRKWDAPQSTGVERRNPSLRPNEMSELLTAPKWRMGRSSSHRREMSRLSPPRREWGAPQIVGMECGNPPGVPMGCQNSRLRPNGRWDPPHRIGGKCYNPSPGRRETGAPRSIGMKCRNPPLRPNEMSELPTVPG
jgi:hypothetical protein